MIGLPGRRKEPEEKIDDLEARVFSLKNRIEGKHVYFFQHRSEGTYANYYYKALVIENNQLVDLTSMFKGISEMLQFASSSTSIYINRQSDLEKALINLSLIAYGKERGFSWSFISF